MIYLLHSTVPVGGTGTHSARHYLGYADDRSWRKRIDAHRAGTSRVKIVDAFLAQGARLLMVAVLPGGTRTDERKLKQMGHLARLCPICNDKREVGWPNGLVALIPRRRASTQPSPKPAKASGGGLPAPSSTPAVSHGGLSLLAPHQESSTLFGENGPDQEPGGTSWSATVPPAPSTTAGSAGTRLPSTFGGSASEGVSDEA